MVVAEQLLHDRTTAIIRAIDPDTAAWGPVEHLLADTFDVHTNLNWRNPKPYPRPGDARRAEERAEARRAELQAQIERNKAREAAAHG